jgi:hypothetical protein
MPKELAHDPTYGYDPETKTVRVAQRDLARLLLMFRKLMREQPPGKWKHVDDYDLSFERPADAVDASSQIRYDKRWTGLAARRWEPSPGTSCLPAVGGTGQRMTASGCSRRGATPEWTPAGDARRTLTSFRGSGGRAARVCGIVVSTRRRDAFGRDRPTGGVR